MGQRSGLVEQRQLEGRRCDKTHPYLRLEGGLPKKAQEYPLTFVRAIVRGIRHRLYPPTLSLVSAVIVGSFGSEL